MFIRVKIKGHYDIVVNTDHIKVVEPWNDEMCFRVYGNPSPYIIEQKEADRLIELLTAEPRYFEAVLESTDEVQAESLSSDGEAVAVGGQLRSWEEHERDINDRTRLLEISDDQVAQMLTAVSRGRAVFPDCDLPEKVLVHSLSYDQAVRGWIARLISPAWEPIPRVARIPFIEQDLFEWIECEVKPLSADC